MRKTMKPKASNKKGFNHLKLVKNAEMIDLSLINLYQSIQSRKGLNMQALVEYEEVWKSGKKFPPVDLYFDGQSYWVGDGFHRIKSRLEANLRSNKIEAIVHQGGKRDAFLHSVGANSQHGVRCTNEDKRHAVTLLLQDDEWSQWSNCEIARKACVSECLVRSVRKEIFDSSEDQPTKRLFTRNGKTYSQDSKNIGKAQKKEELNPLLKYPQPDNLIVQPEGIEKTTGYMWSRTREILIGALISCPEEQNKVVFKNCWSKAFRWKVN